MIDLLHAAQRNSTLFLCLFAISFCVWTLALLRELRRRRTAEAQYRNLFDYAPDATLVMDEAGVIRFVNRETAKTFGYGTSELIGKKIEVLVPERFRIRHAEDVTRFMVRPVRRPMGGSGPLLARRKDGSEFPCEISLSPAKSTVGATVLCSVRDVTRQKEFEAKLQEKSQELVRSNAALERFAYVASHDLEEPLRTIQSYLGLIESKVGTKDRELREFLELAKDAAARQRSRIAALLAYSKVLGKKAKSRPVALNGSLTNVLASLKIAIDESRARVTVEKLPTVSVDPGLVELLFQNLLANALKYRKGDSVNVRIGAKRCADEWVVSVEDDGVGIPPEASRRIFESFTRLHGQEIAGAGIGLATCTKIVESWGGRIWVESSVGYGARFLFTVPVAIDTQVIAAHRESLCPVPGAGAFAGEPAGSERQLH